MPEATERGPQQADDAAIAHALENDLAAWSRVKGAWSGDPARVCDELHRSFEFDTFMDAVGFMALAAPHCESARHHPRWENIWRTVNVYLTTWDIGLRLSDRDLQLARMLEDLYRDSRVSA